MKEIKEIKLYQDEEGRIYAGVITNSDHTRPDGEFSMEYVELQTINQLKRKE